MELKKIFSISGKPGLYKSISNSKIGVIVESLSDGKRFQCFTSEKISTLSEISIYTDTDEMPLVDVFNQIYKIQEGKKAIEAKSDDKSLKEFFLKVVPNFDSDRVYLSHIKKIISWYNILIDAGATSFIIEETPEAEQNIAETSEVKSDEKADKKADDTDTTESKKATKSSTVKESVKTEKNTPTKKTVKNTAKSTTKNVAKPTSKAATTVKKTVQKKGV